MDRSYLIAAALIALGLAAGLLFAVPEAPILPILIAAAVVGALFWLFGDYLPLRRFRPLKERFGFTEGADLLEPLGRYQKEKRPDILTGMWGNYRVQIQYESASRHRSPSLYIHLLHNLASTPDISFYRENLYYRFVKSIGLSREKESDDPIFNAGVYVESENDEALGPLLASPELRSDILFLLSIRRTTVALSPDAVSMTIRGHCGWPKYFKPEKVEEILDRLAAIAKNSQTALQRTSLFPREAPAIKNFEGLTLRERIALLRHPDRLVIFTAALLFFLGPALIAWGARYQTVTWRLHLIGLGLAAVSLAVYTPVVFSSVRGRSQSHRQFATFMFAALVGFPTFCVGALKVSNGFLDLHPPFVVEGQLVSQVSKSTRLNLRVTLPERSGTVSVLVSPLRYRTAKPRQLLPILLSPGALDEPWVVGLMEDKKGMEVKGDFLSRAAVASGAFSG